MAARCCREGHHAAIVSRTRRRGFGFARSFAILSGSPAAAVPAPPDLPDRPRRRSGIHDRDPAARAVREAVRRLGPRRDDDRLGVRGVLADLDADPRPAVGSLRAPAAAARQPSRHVPRVHRARLGERAVDGVPRPHPRRHHRGQPVARAGVHLGSLGAQRSREGVRRDRRGVRHRLHVRAGARRRARQVRSALQSDRDSARRDRRRRARGQLAAAVPRRGRPVGAQHDLHVLPAPQGDPTADRRGRTHRGRGRDARRRRCADATGRSPSGCVRSRDLHRIFSAAGPRVAVRAVLRVRVRVRVLHERLRVVRGAPLHARRPRGRRARSAGCSRTPASAGSSCRAA